MTTIDDLLLVPEPSLLFDGSDSQEAFVSLGNGFMWNLLVARARLQPNHKVLDIGSGNGQKARPLTKYLNSEGSYTGFDVVRDGVDWCRLNYSNFPNFRFDFADLKSDWYNKDSAKSDHGYVFPYEGNSFDVAFMASVATHLLPAGLENYLRQTFRVLKNSGCLLMTCYLVNELNKAHHSVDIQGERFIRYSRECHVLDRDSPSRGVAYDESFLRKLCQDIGYVISEITFGTWSNGTDKLHCLQDSILLVKP